MILLPLMHTEDIKCLVKSTAELEKVSKELEEKYPNGTATGLKMM